MLKQGSADYFQLLKGWVKEISNEEAWANLLAVVVDAAEDEGNEEVLVSVIGISEEIEIQCSAVNVSLIRYLRSNAWASLYGIRSVREKLWEWEQPELVGQIYALRGAIQHPGFVDLPSSRRAQIYCNLGNALSHVGRVVDALIEWKNAIFEQKNLGMAHGNLGMGFAQYGMQLYDEGAAYWLLRESRKELSLAIDGGVGQDGSTYPAALDAFQRHAAEVERELNRYDGPHEKKPAEFSIGRSRREREYRDWCLRKTLFLNPLNDIGPISIAAQDSNFIASSQSQGRGHSISGIF